MDELSSHEDGYGRIVWVDVTAKPVFMMDMKPTVPHQQQPHDDEDPQQQQAEQQEQEEEAKGGYLLVASVRLPGHTCKVSMNDDDHDDDHDDDTHACNMCIWR